MSVSFGILVGFFFLYIENFSEKSDCTVVLVIHVLDVHVVVVVDAIDINVLSSLSLLLSLSSSSSSLLFCCCCWWCCC